MYLAGVLFRISFSYPYFVFKGVAPHPPIACVCEEGSEGVSTKDNVSEEGIHFRKCICNNQILLPTETVLISFRGHLKYKVPAVFCIVCIAIICTKI